MIEKPELFNVIKPIRKVFRPELLPLYDVISTGNVEQVFAYMANVQELVTEFFTLTEAFRADYPDMLYDTGALIRYAGTIHRTLVINNLSRLDPATVTEEFTKTFNPFVPNLISHGELKKRTSSQKFLMYPYIPTGALIVLAGDGGIGKTYLALDMARAIANNESFAGMTTVAGNVLIIDEESGLDRLQERMGKIEYFAKPIPEEAIHYSSYSGFCFSDPQALDALKKLIVEKKSVFCVIDAFMDVIVGNENSVQDVIPALKGLRQIASETQCAILIIHHTNRGGDYRGSSAIKGAVDVLLVANLIKRTDDGHIVALTPAKMRDGKAQTLKVSMAWTSDTKGYATTVYKPLDELKDKFTQDDINILLALKAGRKKIDSLVSDTGLSKSLIHSRFRFGLKDFIKKLKSERDSAFYYELNDDGLDALSDADYDNE